MDNILNLGFALISGTIGALAGTYFGAFLIWKKQEDKINKIRLIAQKALNLIKDYARDRNTYKMVSQQFNNELTVSEKRSILVALHKLGVPIEIPAKDIFSVKNVSFMSREIDKEEVLGMIQQIKKGNCDHLFYLDVDSYFTSNIRLNSIREIGKKYVKEVLSKSKFDKEKDEITFPEIWVKEFTRGELNIILVFKNQLNCSYYYDSHGDPDKEKITQLITEIEIGIWDNYLFWEFEAYQNVISQKNLADTVANQIKMQGQNSITINDKIS